MAHFATRHLYDDISEKYLESKGWVLVSDCKYSKWTLNGVFTLLLRQDDVVATDNQLLVAVASQSFSEGRQRGKQDAVEIINQKLSEIVFPQVKNVDQSYS